MIIVMNYSVSIDQVMVLFEPSEQKSPCIQQFPQGESLTAVLYERMMDDSLMIHSSILTSHCN